MKRILFLGLLVGALPAQAAPGWQQTQPGNCMVYLTDAYPNASATWSGECRDSQASGRGIVVVTHDGREDRYEAEYRGGRATGVGVARWSNGNRYEGEFRDGLPNGAGVFRYPDGSKYEGSFARGLFDGAGIYTFADGTVYQGQFAAEKFAGHGALTLADGTRYAGSFSNDRPNGPGELTRADGSKESGQWRDGCLIVGKRAIALLRPVAECR